MRLSEFSWQSKPSFTPNAVASFILTSFTLPWGSYCAASSVVVASPPLWRVLHLAVTTLSLNLDSNGLDLGLDPLLLLLRGRRRREHHVEGISNGWDITRSPFTRTYVRFRGLTFRLSISFGQLGFSFFAYSIVWRNYVFYCLDLWYGHPIKKNVLVLVTYLSYFVEMSDMKLVF